MKTAATALVVLVAAAHLGFLVLEMFLWRKPFGLKVFRNSQEKANTTAILAANQGLYNGFLGGGLLGSLFLSSSAALTLQIYILVCVILAGLYGGWSFSQRILYIQALPGALALIFVLLSS